MSSLLREVRRMRRGPLVTGAIAVYAVLLAYGALQSVRHVRSLRQQIEAAELDQESRWASLRRSLSAPRTTWSDARSASLVGGPVGFGIATMPIDRLAVLGTGESWRVAPTREVAVCGGEDEPPLENPLAAAGGRFDLAFAIIWLLPLAVIVAGHAAVSGDRQDGIWTSVLATGVDPVRVLQRRLVWPAATLTVVTILIAGAGLAATGLPAAPDEGRRLLMWALALLLHVAVWLGITAATTARARTTSAALLSLGLMWLAIVWAVPAVVDAVALQVHPPLNRWAGDVAARESTRDLEADLPAMLEQVYEEHPEWRPTDEEIAAARRPVPGGPASRDARRVYVPARHAAASAAAERAALRESRQAVERVVTSASVLSPAILLQRAFDEIGGTSLDRVAAFDDAVERLESAWHDFFGPRIMRLSDLSADDMSGVPLPPAGGVPLPPPAVPRAPLLGLVAWLALASAAFAWARPALRR